MLQAAVVQNQAAMSRLAAREAVLLDVLGTRGAGLVPDGQGGSVPLVPWLRDATGMTSGSASSAADDPRCGSRRRADGLVASAQQALDSGTLPVTGGLKPQVTIVVDAHVGPLARPQLLALTCDAEVLLARISGDGTLISLHSAARVVAGGLRKAVNAQDRGCVHTGCPTPAAGSHAHHLQHRADGGQTDIENLALLGPRHHAGWHRGTVHRRNPRLPGAPEPPTRREDENGGHFFARLLETPMPGDARPLRAQPGTAT